MTALLASVLLAPSAAATPPHGVAADAGSAATGIVGTAGTLTLEDALAEARAHNASLPVASAEVDASAARVTQARAGRLPLLSVEGDLLYAPRGAYDPAATSLGEERLQAVLRQPLYAGGALDAEVAAARNELAAAKARYRIAARDVDLDVRMLFDAIVAAREESAARAQAIERLREYASYLEARRAGGQPVGLDLERTRVRIAAAQAALDDARIAEQESRLALNERIGRRPDAPLVPAPLPPPAPPASLPAVAQAPEIDEARAAEAVAAADLSRARSARLPHLALSADAGLWGTGEGAPAAFDRRLKRDEGASAGLSLTWDLLDMGGLRAQVTEARAGVARAARARDEVERQAALQLALARARIEDLSTRVGAARRVVSEAHDASLDAESRYRGGVGTAVDVLDAEADALDAAVREIDLTRRLRDAEALATRWGTP